MMEIAPKNLFEHICERFLKAEITPVAVWSERSFAQHNLETHFYHRTTKHYDEIHKFVSNMLHDKNISIYVNHIVLEFIDEYFGTIYIGINDGYLSISKSVATMDGRRIEL